MIFARCVLTLLLTLPSVGLAMSVSSDEPWDVVQSAVQAAFLDVLREYDEAISARPADVTLALRRCDVIESFAYLEDIYIEVAAEMSESCKDDLEARFHSHPEILLSRAGEMYGDDLVVYTERLHDDGLNFWNNAQHAELHVLTANVVRWNSDDSSRAEFHCMRAMELDLGADCRVDAARWYWNNNDSDVAIELLVSPVDRQRTTFHLTNKIEALGEFEAWDAVATVFAQLSEEDLNDYQRVNLSRWLTKASLPNQARALLDAVSDTHWDAASPVLARIELSRQMGDTRQALTHYNELRDLGFWNDPLLRTRLSLAMDDPTLAWRLRDLLGLGAILATLALLAILAVVVPAGVHYRGLYRQTRNVAAGMPASWWSLREAWYGIFALLFSSVAALYFFEYESLVYLFTSGEVANFDVGEVRYDKLIITMSAVSLLMALPVVLTRARWKIWGTSSWSLSKCVGVAFGIALLGRLLFGIGTNVVPEEWLLGQLSATSEGLIQIHNAYGPGVLLLVVAVIVPVAEETLFRGILLQGFARHISFGGANWIQAILFAGMHEQIVLAPLYVVFGLVAGKMALRSGSILSAILMHGFFNAIAALGIIALLT